ncbi:MAG: hypothetical protein ABSH20_12830 [Tepidisphaeraceae bacterium]
MNPYTLRGIVEYIRSHGGLPTDECGTILSEDDLLVWYGLNNLLTPEEQRQIKKELAAMADAQVVLDQLRANMP